MTNRQYEHLGKAIEKLIRLAKIVQGTGELRGEIENELLCFMSPHEARKKIERVMIDYLPHYRFGDIIKEIVEGKTVEDK